MEILIASDHAGYEMKKALIPFIQAKGLSVIDMGPFEHDPSDDYPDFILPLAEKISSDPAAYAGIVIGGSGQGEAIAANHCPGVRAAVYYGGTLEIVRLSREHNNSNVLSLGARFVSQDEAEAAVQTWLETPFGREERHLRRLDKIR